MNGGKQHSLWICSTPSSLDTQFAKIFNGDDSKWRRYEYNIYDCVKQGLKADPDTLKSIVNDDLIWNTEYMVQFASGSGTAFPTEWLINTDYTSLPESKERWLGYDVARRNDYSVITICAYDRISRDFYIEDIIRMKDKAYNEQIDMVRQLNKKYNIVGGYVDQVGVGSMVAEEIERTVNPRIKGFSWSANNKTELHDNLRSCIQNGNFKINPELKTMVISDFGNVRRYISNTGRISYSSPHTQDGHSDITSSIVLAYHSVHDNPVGFTFPISHQFKSRLIYNFNRRR